MTKGKITISFVPTEYGCLFLGENSGAISTHFIFPKDYPKGMPKDTKLQLKLDHAVILPHCAVTSIAIWLIKFMQIPNEWDRIIYCLKQRLKGKTAKEARQQWVALENARMEAEWAEREEKRKRERFGPFKYWINTP